MGTPSTPIMGEMLLRSLHHFNIHLHLEYPTVPNPRERDQVVMELIFGKVTDKKTIRSLSRCRGSLEIIFKTQQKTESVLSMRLSTLANSQPLANRYSTLTEPFASP